MSAAHDHTNLQISSQPEKLPAIVNLFLVYYMCVCVFTCVCVRDTGIEGVQNLALFSEGSLAMRFRLPLERLASRKNYFSIKYAATFNNSALI
jgi:hypothetical protein